MNKILSITMILGCAALFTACAGEEEDLFDKSAAERLNEMSSIYSQRLEAQPAGWAMQYYPTDDEDGYLILADFNADHSVKVAMNNAFTGNKYKEDESVWDVITDNGPVLSFNTYNELLHIFSDPSDTYGGETGTGIGGDYEFVIVDAPEDASYMMLKGKKRGTYTLLTPLEEGTDFETYLSDVITFQNTYLSASAPNKLFLIKHGTETIQGQTFKFNLNAASNGRRAMVTPEGLDEITYGILYPFLVTKRGGKFYIRFRDFVAVNDGETVREFMYDDERDIFVGTDNEQCTIESEVPVAFMLKTINGNQRWAWQRSSTMSDKMKGIYDNMYNGFRAANLNLLDASFALNQGQLVMRVRSREKSSTNNTLFLYEMTADGEDLNIAFKGASTEGAQKMMDSIAGLAEFLQTFNGKYHVTPATTQFNMSQLRLTSAADAELWVETKLSSQ